MLVTTQFLVPTDSHSIFSIPWKSVGINNCLVTNILQNISFCVQQKKEAPKGLEQLDGE